MRRLGLEFSGRRAQALGWSSTALHSLCHQAMISPAAFSVGADTTVRASVATAAHQLARSAFGAAGSIASLYTALTPLSVSSFIGPTPQLGLQVFHHWQMVLAISIVRRQKLRYEGGQCLLPIRRTYQIRVLFVDRDDVSALRVLERNADVLGNHCICSLDDQPYF